MELCDLVFAGGQVKVSVPEDFDERNSMWNSVCAGIKKESSVGRQFVTVKKPSWLCKNLELV